LLERREEVLEMEDWVSLGYLLSAALFIFGLKKLGHPRTAPFGNQLGALGMLVAVLTTILSMQLAGDAEWVLIGAGIALGSLIGYVMAVRVEMTGMPELVRIIQWIWRCSISTCCSLRRSRSTSMVALYQLVLNSLLLWLLLVYLLWSVG
jgi:NAD/NADP transhydrogenase beta subunit